MKLLITGDTGLLGSVLATESLRSCKTLGVSRSTPDNLAGWQHRSVELTDAEATVGCLDEARPDSIIHCAAARDVDECEVEQAHAWKVNVDATERLAQWAAKNDARFAFISTDSVFDGAVGAYREEDTPRPLNCYARTKLAGERIAAHWCPDSLIVRTNFFGWNAKGKPSLAKWIYGQLMSRKPLRAFTDVRFSPLFVNDVAKVVLELFSRAAKGTFHVASRDSCSKYEFAVLLGRALQFDADAIQPILLEDLSFRAQRPRNTSLAVTKCEDFLGEPMPALKEGIHSFAKTVRDSERARLEKLHVRTQVELTPH